MSDNPTHKYRQIATKIVFKVRTHIDNTLAGKPTDSNFDLEKIILEALKYADQLGGRRTQEHYMALMKEFEEEDGTSSS